jgi:hypothetical protein
MSRLDVFVRYLTFQLNLYSLLTMPSERDSPRDQLVVTLFLLMVFGLLLGAGIKNRMEKAGFNPNFGANSKTWWEVCFLTLLTYALDQL